MIIIARDTQGGPVGAGNAVRYEGRVPHVAGRATTEFDFAERGTGSPVSAICCTGYDFRDAGRLAAGAAIGEKPSRPLNSTRTITASGNRIAPRFKPAKQPRGCLFDRLHFVGVRVSHARNLFEGDRACPEKEFPKAERMFPRVR